MPHQVGTPPCSACGEPISEGVGRQGRDRIFCSPCRTSPAYPQISKRHENLMRKFKVTLHWFRCLLTAQDNSCAICKHPLVYMAEKVTKGSKVPKTLACVDHNHTTGVIRGILCHQCNVLLGHAKDNVGILSNAIKYLHTHDMAST